MKKKDDLPDESPSWQQLEQELNRTRDQEKFLNTLKHVLFTLIAAAGAAVLMKYLVLPSL